ncbi:MULTISPECIES: methyl-accepting chemotaxis protein [Pseudomonas]|uniref:Methyl-accepting chemotaxis protein n=5 Tax=Pseudomonas TaxID=286 RepID=A0A1G5N0S0_9PSED|nr:MULTISPECIES: methyl-accepting chemotaxis protein [Pseudomonas]MBH3330522.1 methyl-accepting chemotaxis protein [Pseudomonas oryzihabitans]MDU4055096.1 methyl-accepting chemotaxis protein [Pseudomonas oryzihabitans]NMY90040.1 methyl-accepting chemotaxis protein [Pseudomonas psychrotolerans]NMZ63885.1 methyl-accepting chemotaxis protein [Pseudomonas oryzihabitans]ONN70450.1 methyl-accepting chemotaxis protein [Pseudomonas psychrotolerans]
MNLRSLNVAPRAVLFFSVIVLIVFALGGVAVVQMGKLYDAEQEVETNWLPGNQLAAKMSGGLLRLRLESLRATTTPDPQLRAQTVAAFPGYREAFFTAVKDYERTVADAEDRQLYAAVVKGAESYRTLLDTFEPKLRAGDNEGAIALINTSIRPLTNALEKTIAELNAFNERGAKAAGQAAGATYANGLLWVYGLIGLTIAATVVLAALLIRSITLPVGEALRIAQRIARKDLTERITVVGRDEAAGMLQALAQMQGNLRDTVSHIADSSTQLASAAEEMTAVIDEAGRGYVRQNDEVNQAASAVTEMSSAVEEVARNAADAASTSLHTQTLTSDGLDKVTRTVQSIEALAQNVASTSEQIQALSSRAQDINAVVEVIRGIAEQTNLLALNAAIEAARAGEQGRGFAVVADEVRALAHRTQQSTREIEQMIGAIQSDSSLAVKAMAESQQLAGESTSVAQLANVSLEQIAASISQINDRNAVIATAAEEQAQVAREIDRNITSIRDLATQSATGATQTASASAEVSKLATGLNRVVREFAV